MAGRIKGDGPEDTPREWDRPGLGVQLLDGAVVSASCVTGVRLHSVGGAPPRYQVALHYGGEWVGYFQSRHRERAEWEMERLRDSIFSEMVTPPEEDGPEVVVEEKRAEIAPIAEPREGVAMENPYRIKTP